MRIEEPITVVKANFDNDETKALNDAIKVLANLAREMKERHFTECVWSDYDDDYEIDFKEVNETCLILEKLTQLTGLQ